MEAFLGVCIVEEDRWNILYLALALDCDMPILEAYWHSCYKMTCLRWEKETQSYRNRAFRQLLRDTFCNRTVAAYPTWEQLSQGDNWALMKPMRQHQPFIQYFNIKGSESYRFMTVGIGANTKFFHQPGAYPIEHSFTVQWEVTEVMFAVSIDAGDWQTIEAGAFIPLVDAQLRRLITLFA